MDLLAQSRIDLKRFSQSEWSTDLTFQNVDKSVIVTIKGFASSHHLSIDPSTGLPVNVRNTHISVSETLLSDAGYTVRNSDGEVNLIRHFVTYTNSAGQEKTFRINETFPDETLGLIVCILGDYTA